MAELTSNSGVSNNKTTTNKARTFSPNKSLSPPVFRRGRHQPSASHIPLPPCIWDVEYPRQQHLRRSVSVSSTRGSIHHRGFKPPSCTARSLWSAENKEYLEMRFGLFLHPEKEQMEMEINLKEQMEVDDQQQHQHDTSEDSSIFSNPDCSSFSSGNSEDFSSAKDEPVSISPNSSVPAKAVEAEDEFLEFRLEQGNLVDNPRAVTRTSDHPAKRHNVDSIRLESPRRKLCSSNRPSFTNDDRYPVWSGANSSTNSSTNAHSHLMRSYTESARPKLSSSASSSASTSSSDHRRNLTRLLTSPVPRFHFSPARFMSSKPPKEDESVSVPASGEIHPQNMVSKRENHHPEVHCKSFFLRKPSSFIRRKKKEESRPMPESDGYRVAHLHCAVRSDHHSYTFVMDGTEEVMLARTPRLRGTEDESNEQPVCSFYSQKRRATRSQSWKRSWPMSTASSNSESTSEIVASMKVCRKECSEDQAVELEFVLFDAAGAPAEDEPRLSFSSWDTRKSPHSSYSTSTVSSSSSVALNPGGQKRSWWSLMPGSPVLRRKLSKPALASPRRGLQPEENMDVLKDIWKEMEDAESLRKARAANRLQELAAIVVTHSTKPKTQIRSRSNSMESLLELGTSGNSNSKPVSLTLVLPVGQHGMPTEGISGPSPLLKRWRLGRCDCGGWDMGCQLQILHTSHEAESLFKLMDVSLQGAGKDESSDAFNLVGLNNGLFSIRFKDQLSPLQAFATAVAALYRSPSSTVNRDINAEQWSKVLGLPNPLLHLERL